MTRPANGRTAQQHMSPTWWLKATPAEVARLPDDIRAKRARMLGVAEPAAVPELEPPTHETYENLNERTHRRHEPDFLAVMLLPFVGYVIRGDAFALVFLQPDGAGRPHILPVMLCPAKIRAWRDARRRASSPVVIRRRRALAG